MRGLQQIHDGGSRDLQFGESEHPLAEIFQRGTDVIDVIAVHYQETIVASPIGADVDGRILVVVTDEEINLTVYPVQALLMFLQFAVYALLHTDQSLVDRVPSQQVFLQYLVCPTAELNAPA